jgi:predicted DNA-binding transcriptional regulator YafY
VYHPTTRLLTVLELLQVRKQIGGRELAERLEVDERTVRRYILMLQELGIPVESTRGRYGAYRLQPGFKLPPLMFTEDEALAIELGLLLARRLGVSDAAPAVEGALAKIERVLPATTRERVQAVQESLILSTTPASTATDSVLITSLSVAVSQHRRVWLRYRAWSGDETEREFEPYGVVHREGFWYTVGYCYLRHDLRVFRLDRALAIEMREEKFTPPSDFDCLAYVERAVIQTPGPLHIEVLLHTTLAEAHRSIPSTQATLDETRDGILMRCHIKHLTWMACTLATLDFPVTILYPETLRETLHSLAQYQLAANSYD